MWLKNLSADALLNVKERRREMHTFRLENLGSPEGDLEAKTRFQSVPIKF
jgi:hypothetical protein